MPKPVKSDPRSGTKRGIVAFAYESSTVFRLSGVFHLLSNGELFLLLSPKHTNRASKTASQPASKRARERAILNPHRRRIQAWQKKKKKMKMK